MAKPSVFIGSSVEHKKLAETVQSLLDYDVSPIVWTQGTFEPTHSPLESLEVSLEKIDFAVLICAPEENDVSIKRGQTYKAVRDNIIFELGLFIGRLGRKRTFLISPRGVDLNLPTDLTGIFPETYDLNLLADNPEAALGPACAKIKRTISKLGTIPRGDATDVKEEPKEYAAETKDSRPLVSTPKSEWTLGEFEWRYLLARLTKNDAEAAQIDDAFHETAHSQTEESKAYWEAWKEYAILSSGQTGNLNLVRSNSERFADSSRIKEVLSRFIEHYGDPEQAGTLLDEALENADSMKLVCKIVNRAVAIHSTSNLQGQVLTYLTKLNSLPRSNHDDKVRYLRAVHTLAKAAGFEEISKTLMEMLLGAQPDDIHSRFKLAYDYSETNQSELALLHYDAIPVSERSGAAWNNLGVAYNRHQLRSMAVNAYREASKKGATIADGNLANLFLGAGFFDEARAQAETALIQPDHDKMVVAALSTLQEAMTNEATAKETLLAKSIARQKSRRAVGQRAIAFEGHEIEDEWMTPDGLLALKRDGLADYVGSLEFFRETTRAGLGLIAKHLVKERVQITIKLRRFGSSMEGTISRETPDLPSGILGLGRERKVLLAISEDGQTIRGIELDYEETPVSWTRKPAIRAIS
ncbi:MULTISPECIES: nucleotide-binding protein [Rhizobium/Agrobacterium group]|uniref:CD-NTase-associated protein 12/Pycsar effector protein TIR domain-containing protein n=1 Tax=Rhizobium rhizogenes TaxID=359 RepID=A0A546XI30_RHIRH|nr:MULTISPECIES: nucleotide-binding protein [Rhizobium/Agrobacterium group]TRB00390.1 hypothetical protein EXN68_11760 [Rhizobium rhizogenes]